MDSIGNPAIPDLASVGPEALRRRLSTVMPLFDVRSVSVRKHMTYRAVPHRHEGSRGKEGKENDETDRRP